MRVVHSWLAEYVPGLPDAATCGEALTRASLKLETVERAGESLEGVVVGEVLHIDELTDFKKPIRYVQVGTGAADPRGIVCGATNFAVGDRVPVALPGAVLPGGFVISARKTYGHVSDGMICSSRELGIGDDHAGILVLSEADLTDVRPGDDALPLLGLDDVTIEVNVTPDRGYCFSLRGIAREYALSTGGGFRDPADIEPPAADVA